MDTLAPFIVTATLIELTPGPNMAFLAVVSATEGRRKGYATVAGVTLGLLIVGILAALGLAAVISQSAILFEILRWGGIAYLLFLAVQGWKDIRETSPHAITQKHALTDYFRHGLVINLLNPKAALFYIAILPTFLNPEQTGPTETVTLTLIYVIIATLIHLIIVSFAALLHPFLAVPGRNRLTRRGLSLALAAVALWFGWSTRGGIG